MAVDVLGRCVARAPAARYIFSRNIPASERVTRTNECGLAYQGRKAYISYMLMTDLIERWFYTCGYLFRRFFM